MQTLYLIVPLAPLLGAILAGILGPLIGRRGAHSVTIALMLVSFGAAAAVFRDVLDGHTFNGAVYTWLASGDVRFDIGFLIDRLSATMMLVVTFVSLAVHVYTIGYMADDPGYQRFFSYISLFTFSMLMLVMSNNFVQLFFGWEAVGLVSYLLIGFWYTRPSAIYANLKAFLVNRVGDLGFLLGIALILAYAGSLDYARVFGEAKQLSGMTIELFTGHAWSLATVICILLFVGAMGKSAQFPLHVWLPDSMEGPTPISALIHAATMVTAGIFMVARMSPLFELSETALSFVIVIGAITALFMAFIAIVQNDIKRVVAYSTLSQLGYMTVALGASAYSAAIFHLATHAFFKAVLFLGAGSVIIALHHQQDMRYMGGLRKYMPITYATMMIAALASAGIPGLSGFFSKDAIIEATRLATVPGAGFAYFCVSACVFVTALYTFRMMFMTFHGKARFADAPTSGGHDSAHASHGKHAAHESDHVHGSDQGNEGDHGHGSDHAHGAIPHESPAVVTLPLIALAIPAICAGWLIGPVLFGPYFGASIVIAPEHNGLAVMAKEFHGVLGMMQHALFTAPFWLSLTGIVVAWYLYIKRTDLPAVIASRFALIYRILERKYGFDEFNDWFFARGSRGLGQGLWRFGDAGLIDGVMVNGSARLVAWFAGIVRYFQSGFIYHYAFTMIIGVLLLVTLLFMQG
ncbi:MAG: NADH-quinone oxidoreductase subunit L [Burkholderiales bacterium]|nr:NADH-quinone oxidoreductase subunit L [Burkholderiales bacterium]